MTKGPELAIELSLSLLDEARAFIDERLTSPLWVKEYRSLVGKDDSLAVWHIVGRSELTEPEIEALRSSYVSAGWSEVERYKSPFPNSNWAFRFKMRVDLSKATTGKLRWTLEQ